jgi:hypothetical protein
MPTIGIVGAGAAAAAATHVLDGAGADVTVLEKSGGVCGRAATRRHDDLVYDYGANYVNSADERIVRLLTETLDDEGLIEVPEPIYTFDDSGAVSPGRENEGRKLGYRAGLTQLAKRLFAGTAASVHRRTRVETLRREDDGWALVDADGGSWGPFDVVVLTPPAPQTATLLRDAEWSSDRRDSLLDAVASVDYRACWTAVLHYPFELDVPYYALVNTDKNHAVGWIAREECKPSHVPPGESLLVVQANHDWSVAHSGDDPERNVARLAEHAAEIVGDDRLASPNWTDHQGWRYALPRSGVRSDPVASVASAGLFCAGDWVVGEGRLHAALGNGLDVGGHILDAL